MAGQSLAVTRAYLCAYGTHEDIPYLHILDKESGALLEIDDKVKAHYWQNLHFFTNEDEICILGHGVVSKEEFQIRKIEKFGFGEIEDSKISSSALVNVYGYSELNNSIIAHQFLPGKIKDFVFQYNFDDLKIRNIGRIPHRRPPEIYDQNETTEERPQKIVVNQFGEIAILIKGWVDNAVSPMYSRIEIFGEENDLLRHKKTLYIADETEFYFPHGLVADLDGSFLVLTGSFDYTEPDRLSVHRCKRDNSDSWALEKLKSFSMEGQQFSVVDIFVAGGYIFVAGATDRGVRKPLPGYPKVNYERYPFIYSFRRADGQNTDLVSTNFHSSEDEEWSAVRASVDIDFIYLHGFVHGKPNFKRFEHDGSPVPF